MAVNVKYISKFVIKADSLFCNLAENKKKNWIAKHTKKGLTLKDGSHNWIP